jgi:hypothetical protein
MPGRFFRENRKCDEDVSRKVFRWQTVELRRNEHGKRHPAKFIGPRTAGSDGQGRDRGPLFVVYALAAAAVERPLREESQRSKAIAAGGVQDLELYKYWLLSPRRVVDLGCAPAGARSVRRVNALGESGTSALPRA